MGSAEEPSCLEKERPRKRATAPSTSGSFSLSLVWSTVFLCADSTRFEKTGLGVFEAEDNLRVTVSSENLAKEKQNRKVENFTLDDKSLGPKDESKFQTLWECPQSEVRQNSSGCLRWETPWSLGLGIVSQSGTGTSRSLCVLGLEREDASIWDGASSMIPFPSQASRSGPAGFNDSESLRWLASGSPPGNWQEHPVHTWVGGWVEGLGTGHLRSCVLEEVKKKKLLPSLLGKSTGDSNLYSCPSSFFFKIALTV